MNTLINIGYWIYNIDYWQSYLETRKVKEVLDIFFEEEDIELQKAFVEQFDYPSDMTENPVRMTDDGDIYYVLNFKSKELFENNGTQEVAYANSLKVLDKHLPMGVTNYLETIKPIRIDDSFSLLCSLKLVSDVSTKRTIVNGIVTLLTSGLTLGLLTWGGYSLYNYFI